MAIFTIDSLQSAADAYIAQPSAELFMAVEEWIAHSYEQGGDYTEEQLEQMDFKSAAEQFIQRRREQS